MSSLTTARLICDFCEEVGEVVGAYRLAVMGSGDWKSFWNGSDICPECWAVGARFCRDDWGLPVRCLKEV